MVVEAVADVQSAKIWEGGREGSGMVGGVGVWLDGVDFRSAMDDSIAGRVELSYSVGDSMTNDALADSTEKCALGCLVSLLVLWERVVGGEQHGEGEEGL